MKGRPHKRGLLLTMAIAVMFLSIFLSPLSAQAITAVWIGDTGWWNEPNWLIPPGPPGPLDDVYLVSNDAIDRTVYYFCNYYNNYSIPPGPFASLTIDATGTGTMTLNQGYLGYSHPLAAYYEYIGYAGTGAFIQSAGTNDVTYNLYLGYSRIDYETLSNGTYDLSGTGILTAGSEYIGYAGMGAFTQTGGTNAVTYDLYLGYYPGIVYKDVIFPGNGTYDLSGTGILTAGSEYIGYAGTGAFTQSGGTNAVTTNLYLGSSWIEIDAGDNEIIHYGNGTYDLSGTGTLTAVSECIGDFGTGAFTQSGGTNAVTANLYLGYLAKTDQWWDISTSNGTYDLSGTGTLTAGSEYIGYAGTGAFTQSGGTNAVTANLYLGYSWIEIHDNDTETTHYGNGTYDLSGTGILTAGSEYIGYAGMGAFTQSGGTNAVTANLCLGYESTGNGTYDLSAGTLSANSEYIGYEGTGTFTQSGGTNTVANTLTIANNTGSNGTYNLSGGTLTAGTIVNNDTFEQFGGIVNGTFHNTGTFNYYGGTFPNGGLTNSATGTVTLTGATTTVTGDITNNGVFKTTDTTVTFAGSYTENGAFISDPSDNSFNDWTIGETGYVTGGVSDNFYVLQDFINHSLQNTLWDTDEASLILNGVAQEIHLAGADLGATFLGYEDNFSWGSFTLNSGVSLNIFDGNTIADAALYVGLLTLGDGLDQLLDIYSDYNIYYDTRLAGNAWLSGQTYALNGTGLLAAAVPVPGTVLLLGSGLLALVGLRRRGEVTRH